MPTVSMEEIGVSIDTDKLMWAILTVHYSQDVSGCFSGVSFFIFIMIIVEVVVEW